LFASPAWALRGWKWPFFATFTLPVLIFALTFLDVQIPPLLAAALPRERRVD